MKKFTASMKSFQENDMQSYSDAFDSYYNSTEDVYTEHRWDRRTNKVCIINFYSGDRGYDIYQLEKSSNK